MKKVAVLGGAGFLGQELQKVLKINGNTVLSLSRNKSLSAVENFQAMTEQLNAFAPEIVVNCIAK